MASTPEQAWDDLRHPDRDVRMRTALALGDRAEPSAATALVARLRDEPDFFVRDMLTWTITRVAQVAAEPTITLLLAELGAADIGVRVQALHVLSKIADPATTGIIMALADDDEPAVAAKARWALTRIGEVRALPALTAYLGRGEEHQRNDLTRDLASFGAAAVPDLTEALCSADAKVRSHAAEVLNVVGPAAESAVMALASVLDDTDAHVRLSAAMALYEIRTDAALEALGRYWEAEDPRVRAIARRACCSPG